MSQRLLPVTDDTSEPFWQGARQGRLMLQRCPQTGRYQWYPRAHVLADPLQAPAWVQAAGTGTIFSCTTIHRGGVQKTPYVCALVTLDEGVLMLARIVDAEPAEVHIGQRVQVAFDVLTDELTLPVFSLMEPA